MKDVTLLTLFSVRKFIDNTTNPDLRPKFIGKGIFSRIQRETSVNIRNYLMDPNNDGIDEEGNTTMHQLTKFEHLQEMDQQINQTPHLLFMLNKLGMTPLDVAIQQKEEDKAKLLIDRMQKYNNNCSLKFV